MVLERSRSEVAAGQIDTQTAQVSGRIGLVELPCDKLLRGICGAPDASPAGRASRIDRLDRVIIPRLHRQRVSTGGNAQELNGWEGRRISEQAWESS